MKNLTIYASDLIRMRPNRFTVHGLGMAVQPYLKLPLTATDDELRAAIATCLAAVPDGPDDYEGRLDGKEYLREMGVRSQGELGRGVDVVYENGRYTLTPIQLGGEFEDPLPTVGEEEVVERVRAVLGLRATAE